MNIEACVSSQIFKSPLRAIIRPETYQEGFRHLCFSCQKETAEPLTLLDRVQHIAFGLCLLIPIINAIALFILQRIYDGTFSKIFLPIALKISSSFSGVKTDYLIPAFIGFTAAVNFVWHRKFKLALAMGMHATLQTIHATMGLFLPSEVKLLNKVTST
jgi:hypothetical protein